MSNKFSTYKIYAALAGDAYLDDKEQNKSLSNYKFEGAIHNPLTGFDLAIYSNGNEKVISFRGTDSSLFNRPINTIEDLFNDLLLGTQGNNPQGAYNLVGLYDELVEQGYISSTDKIVVTGHSLGGYLAQLFTIANEDKISHTYTYNAPGLLGLTGTLLNLFGTSNIKSNKITDILAKDSINFTNAMGLNAGEEIKVSGNSHAIEDLTQILYFYDMAVSNGASENVVTNYLSGFYNAQNSLLIGSVANIVQGTISKIDEIVRGNSNPNADIVEICNAYETNNVKFRLDLIAPTSSVTSIFSGSNLTTPALYALVNLNPFIVSNINSNAYSELEKYKDEFSENYIKDKAKMFEAVLKYPNTKPVNFNYFDIKTKKELYSNYPGSIGIQTDVVFGTNLDETIQARSNFNNRIYALAGNDSIEGGKYNNYIEAGSGNDIIDLRDSKGENVVYGGVNNGKDNDDDGNDIIYGGKGKDTMYGGSGFDSYYAGNGDIIEDDEKGQGFVYFNSNSPLTGGTYDKDKGCYVGGIYEYHLNGKTLIVKDTTKDESITINNYHKDKKSLGIDLIKADEIDIIISNATVTEGDESEPNKDGKAPYNTTLDIKLNRKLKEDEFIIIQKYNYKKQATELVLFGTLPKDYDTTLFKNLLSNNKTLDFSWYGNKTKEEDKKYCVGGVNIFAKSDNLTIRDIKPGYVTIKDDDKDPNDDKPETYDPLVIDLNNDGIKGTNLDYKINFDLDNNGFKEATSWIDNNDAFIAIDKNNNGTIDNGSELFGNKSISNNAYAYTNPNAKNGFENLKELDSNNDGIIDEKDKEFTNLLLWQDKNSNGISETDELIKLSDKVKSINLNLLIA
jgi:type I secretion target GGXGXDXXX repeat protein domain protein